MIHPSANSRGGWKGDRDEIIFSVLLYVLFKFYLPYPTSSFCIVLHVLHLRSKVSENPEILLNSFFYLYCTSFYYFQYWGYAGFVRSFLPQYQLQFIVYRITCYRMYLKYTLKSYFNRVFEFI